MLTERQERLLLSILKEYLDTAQPVGSIELRKKYDIDASSATIRNEMVELSRLGFLEKEHISSGRKPTALAWRWFLNEALEEKMLAPSEETETKMKIFKQRFQKTRLVKEAVENVTKLTHYPSVALIDDTVLYAGIGELLEYPEFQEIEVLQNILNVIEDYTLMNSIFTRHVDNDSKVKVLIGNELGINAFGQCSVVFAYFNLHRSEKGIISVIGPSRMNYSKVIPAIRYVVECLNEAVNGW